MTLKGKVFLLQPIYIEGNFRSHKFYYIANEKRAATKTEMKIK